MLQEFRDDGDGDHRQGRGSQRAEHGRRPSTGFHFAAPCCARPTVPSARSPRSSWPCTSEVSWIVILPQPQRDDKPINMEHVPLVKYVPRAAVEDFRYATRALFLHSFMPQRSCLSRGPTCPSRACLRGAQVSKNAVSL